MTRKYHEWTKEEVERIGVYLENTEHPTSLYKLAELAEKMGLPPGSVRGKVLREMKRSLVDVREGR